MNEITPASSLGIEVANAIVGELTDNGFVPAFTAKRRWLPVFTRDQLVSQGLTVSVVAMTRPMLVPLDRAKRRWQYGIVIDFQKVVETADLVELDALVNLVDGQVTDFYSDFHDIAGAPAWYVKELGLVNDSVYSIERLYEESIFEAAVTLLLEGNL